MIKNQALIDHPGNRVGDNQELTTRPRSITYREKQGANCGGLIQSGNCGGDSFWAMPDGNWWTWPGIGGSPTNRSRGSIIQGNVQNPSGYDFVGGQTTQDQPVPTVNERIFGGYGLVESRGHQDVYERVWYNCNCGVGSASQQVNCYSNCNCNCNCACNCACDCTCFPAGTLVLMADGAWRPIETLRLGDKVLGLGGINTVTGLYSPRLGDRRLFVVDQAFSTTADHLIWTDRGWSAIDPAFYGSRRYNQKVEIVTAEGAIAWRNDDIAPRKIIRLEIGARVGFRDGYRELSSLVPDRAYLPETRLYCPVLDGSRSFMVNGGYVVDGFAGKSVDYSRWIG